MYILQIKFIFRHFITIFFERKMIQSSFFLLLIIVHAYCMSYQEFFALTDQQIWSQPHQNGHLYFGTCIILDSRNQSNVCDYYVSTGDKGLPENYGSGCLKAPISSCPTCTKNTDVCWTSSNYHLYDNTWPICTSNHIKNAANMIRIGVLKGYCNISNYTITRNLSNCSNATTSSSSSSTATNSNTYTSSNSSGTICQCNCNYPSDFKSTQQVSIKEEKTINSQSSKLVDILILIFSGFTFLIILFNSIYKCCKRSQSIRSYDSEFSDKKITNIYHPNVSKDTYIHH